jgi:hypothetical protein
VTGQWFSPVLWFPPFNLSNCLDNVKEEEREYPIQWSLSSKLMNQIPKKKYSFHPSIKQLFMQRWFDTTLCDKVCQ